MKILGLCLLAAGAICAVGAPAASADPIFHSEVEDTILTGSQGTEVPTVLTTDKGELKCEIVKFSGTWSATTNTTLTLKPTWENCKMGGITTFVTTNGCALVFHLGLNTETFESKMDLECPAGKQLVVEPGFCTITIPPQAGLQQVTFTNEGEGTTRALVADLNVGGIDYKEHGAECGSEGEGTTTNGTLTGRITVKGEKAGGQHVGIWVD
ncbi:MAG TPA: hypothetical protein VF085_02795 [Solirubrobacterales bacterium]